MSLCYLPALQQALGLSHHNSLIFYSRCYCQNSQKKKRNDESDTPDAWGQTDFESKDWQPYEPGPLKEAALLSQFSQLQNKAIKIKKQWGCDHTPFWNLLYFNPALLCVADPMHTLYKGIVKCHFMKLLKLTEEEAHLAILGPQAQFKNATPKFTCEYLMQCEKELRGFPTTSGYNYIVLLNP